METQVFPKNARKTSNKWAFGVGGRFYIMVEETPGDLL